MDTREFVRKRQVTAKMWVSANTGSCHRFISITLPISGKTPRDKKERRKRRGETGEEGAKKRKREQQFAGRAAKVREGRKEKDAWTLKERKKKDTGCSGGE